MKRSSEGITPNQLLRWFDARKEDCVSTTTVADAFDVAESAARDRLETLASQGDLERVDLEGEYVAWERPVERYVGREDGGGYLVQDRESGLLTRAPTRAGALERLAEAHRRYESSPLGAQVLSLANAEINPDYLESLEEIRTEYVQPSDRHLLVLTRESGIEEIDDEAGLRADEQVLGFTLSGCYSAADYDDILLTCLETLLEDSRLTREHFPVSVVRSVVVHPDWAGEGCGRKLASTTRSLLGDSRPLLTTIWDRENEANKRLAEKFTDERLLRFTEDHGPGYTCIECGFGETCSCESILYAWRLDAA